MKPIIIAIAGASGSGKTTIRDMLVQHFSNECVYFSVDNYYKNVDEVANSDFDDPEALDWALFKEDLRKLKQGEAVDVPQYDFATSTRQGYQRIESKKLIIIDGILAFYTEELRQLIDIPIFVDVKGPTCLSRRINRDIAERERSEESVRKQWVKVSECYQFYVEPSMPYAFFQLENNENINTAQLNIEGIINDLNEIILLRDAETPTVIARKRYSLFGCEKPNSSSSLPNTELKIIP